jgi:hypothetical protein
MATKKKPPVPVVEISPRAQGLVAGLTSAKSPQRSELVDLLLDHVLAQPVASLLPAPKVVHAWLLDGATEANLARTVSRHLLPAWDRLLVRTRADGTRPGDLLGREVREAIDRTIGTSRLPSGAWARNALDGAALRGLVAPVLQDTLVQFARKLPIPGAGAASAGGGAGGGLLGGLASRVKDRVEKQAERAFEVGRGLLGGLGAELERQVHGIARDFSSSATDDLKRAFAARFEDAEGKRLLRQLRGAILDAWLATPIHELLAEVDAVPARPWLELQPQVVAHVLKHPAVRAGLLEELEAWHRVEGGRPLRDLLAEAGLLESTRAAVRPVLDAQARAFFATPGVGGWLSSLLGPAEP